MLPKNERLRKKKEFEQVFNQKCSVSTASIVTYVAVSEEKKHKDPVKVGVIVAKKVHKKATKRNKIKRRIREAYRNLKSNNPELTNNFKSIIFIARPAILELNYTQILNNIEKCLKKAEKSFIKKRC